MNKNHLPKRLAAGVLTALLTAMPAAAFSDTEGHWAQGAIAKWSSEYHVIQGYEDGTFHPDQSITRGAFAGIMDRFLKFQVSSAPETFSDTAGTYWESAILKLHAAGVYQGDSGKALSGDPITRQQAVTMIARAFQITGEAAAPLPYGDSAQIAEYAKGAVDGMSDRGYITDSWNGDFRPTAAITRAEIVNILGNMIQMLIQENQTYSGNVDGTVMINAEDGASLSNMTIPGDLILAPGVTGTVTLTDVTISGSIKNFSGVQPSIITTKPSQTPETPETPETPTETKPAIQPGEVYTPGTLSGETIAYGSKTVNLYAGRERNQLGAGDFYWDGSRLVYAGDKFRTRFGIDVSAYQNRSSTNNTIDWNAVANDGVEFAMVRVGLRGYSNGKLFSDAFYKQNIQGAMEAGIETGAYFYAQAITVEEAIEEADYVIELLKDCKINGPVAYDWEMHDATYRVYGTTPEMATACAIAFCRRIAEAGYTPMIYAGSYVSYIKYDQGAIAPYLCWYPEYKSATSEKLFPSFAYQMNYWQFSSSCSVAGIGGRVDANLQFIPQ